MGWSVTVTDPKSYKKFETDIQELWAREHEGYPYDADLALEVARKIGLNSATLSGGRTPIPGSEDEVVVITITGTVKDYDFLAAMRRAIVSGPDEDTPVYRHYVAMSRLRAHPCMHDFARASEESSVFRCVRCKVNLQKGLMWFDE